MMLPGMDPYLENPALWPEVHSRLMVAIADILNPQILPKYRASIEQRVYDLDADDSLLVGIPDVTVEQSRTRQKSPKPSSVAGDSKVIAVIDKPSQPLPVLIPMPVEVKERYLEIKAIQTGEVVAVVEILSPVNKRTGKGRNTYIEKRLNVLGSLSHLIEIDLLRSHSPMPLAKGSIQSNYRILVSRSEQRPRAELYAFNLDDSIPLFQLPLKDKDAEPTIDLKTLINEIYAKAGYAILIDYTQPPTPPLTEKETEWFDKLQR
ncbi:MAG: DUF4058 family protein [Cyanobacteria bacterium P01_C01_bin.69]